MARSSSELWRPRARVGAGSFWISTKGVTSLILLGGAWLVGVAVAQEAPSGEWPQFRGPGGHGTSMAVGLPTTWSADSANIRWSTRIPGRGASSPIVTGGKVILTTAYPDEGSIVVRAAFVGTGVVLAVLILGFLVLGRLRKPGDGGEVSGEPSEGTALRWMDRIVVFVGFPVLLVSSIAVLLGPDTIDGFLAQLRQLLPANRTGGIITWHVGNDAAIWLGSGLIALLGLSLAVVWFPSSSAWRVVGGIGVFAATAAFFRFTPMIENSHEVTFVKRAVFAFPGIIVASWCLLGFVLERVVHRRVPDAARSRRAWRPALATCMLAVLVFVPPNFVQREQGIARAFACVDLESGALLWTTEAFVGPSERKHHKSTYATPTACTDGERVYANFGGGVACVDLEGNLLWIQEDPEYYKHSLYGAVSSTILVDGGVVAVQSNEGRSERPTWIRMFDRESGRIVWELEAKTRREAGGAREAWLESYVTPILWTRGGSTELVASFREIILAFDPRTGERLWSQETPICQQVAGMARSGDILAMGGGTAGPRQTLAMRLTGEGSDTHVEVLWRAEDHAPGCSSPVIHNGMLFTVDDYGSMTCHDLLTGKVHWRNRLPPGKYFCSLLAADGKIYACNHYGVTVVLAAEEEFKILGKNDLDEETYATPAITDDTLLIRTDGRLFRIGGEGSSRLAQHPASPDGKISALPAHSASSPSQPGTWGGTPSTP